MLIPWAVWCEGCDFKNLQKDGWRGLPLRFGGRCLCCCYLLKKWCWLTGWLASLLAYLAGWLTGYCLVAWGLLPFAAISERKLEAIIKAVCASVASLASFLVFAFWLPCFLPSLSFHCLCFFSVFFGAFRYILDAHAYILNVQNVQIRSWVRVLLFGLSPLGPALAPAATPAPSATRTALLAYTNKKKPDFETWTLKEAQRSKLSCCLS